MGGAATLITQVQATANTFRASATGSLESMVSQALALSPTNFTPGTVVLDGLDVLPDTPTINTSLAQYKPVNTSQLLTALPELPAAWAHLVDEYFPPSDLEEIAALMREFVKPEYLANVRAVFVGDLERALAGRRREVLATFQDRGFIVPSGAMAGALAGVEAAADDKVREFDSDLAAKAMDRWFDFAKWATQVYIEAKRAEFEAYVQLVIAYLRAQLDVNKNNNDTALALADIAKAEAALKAQVATLSFERARLQLSASQLKLQKFDAESRLQIEALHSNTASQANVAQARVSALNMAASSYAGMAAAALQSASGIAVLSETV